ncbi:uncharacterized protein LOC114579980 [Dendrobium catenatum]|uniref:uncharacterized protein LOC114579980 n=1 Tax=Dendrobium catenatum TaxID=906689 RepID=UPI0010A08252|nr:uncharacterized protein LOC114579980 [Dendrobium catenatum]
MCRYWLYAAVNCKCLVVTNDEMRDHLFALLGKSFFPRWKEKHQPSKNPILENMDADLRLESHDVWHPPPLDWIKFNVDASLMESYNAGIGVIIRNHKGRFLRAFGKQLRHWDVATLELQSILLLREQLQRWMLQYKGVIIEGDNANVIKWFHESLKKVK